MRWSGAANMPKVSVIIPTYNRAHLVTEAIRSVLEQSIEDLEVIVIDDGSTDRTREIVSPFPVKYVWYENQGPPGARNKGITLSAGEYVAFLDSDDILLPQALEKGVRILSMHPEAAFSYGQAYIIDKEGRVIALEKPHLSHTCVRPGWEELREYLLFGNHFTSSTVMVRRRCLEEAGGFNVAFRRGSSDLELWVRLSEKHAVAHIAEPLAKFREHGGEFSAGRSLSEWEETNSSILGSVLNDLNLNPLLGHLRPTAYFRLYSGLADTACYRRERKTAWHYLKKALRVQPSGLFQRQGLPWLIVFAKVSVPWPLLILARKLKRFVRHLFLLARSAGRLIPLTYM